MVAGSGFRLWAYWLDQPKANIDDAKLTAISVSANFFLFMTLLAVTLTPGKRTSKPRR